MYSFDRTFVETVKDILENGYSSEGGEVRTRWSDGAPAHYIRKFGVVNRYDLSEEFPISTQRWANFPAMIQEMLWIWQKKSNNIHDLGLRIWDSWADENGSIGKAYGYQLGKKSTYKEGEFDQVDKVIFDLTHDPNSRRIITEIYIPDDLKDMSLSPCAHGTQWLVANGRLNLILRQRSQDMLAANCWNVTQYAVLCHMMAQACGYQVGELIHFIGDAHIYDRHIPIIKYVIDLPVFPAPRLIMDPTIDNFYDFTVDSFKLENYQHGPKIDKIPIAI